MSASATHQFHRLALGFGDDIRMQVLRAGKDVKAKELQIHCLQFGQERRRLLDIDAELLRATAHAHAGALDLEIRIDPQRHARTNAEAFADLGDARGFQPGFQLDRHAGGYGPAEFGRQSFPVRQS